MIAVEKIQEKLPQGCAAFIYEDCVIQWLTGFYTDNGLVCLTRDSGWLLTDGRYSEAASRTVSSVTVQTSSKLTQDALELIRKESIHTIYLEQSNTSLSTYAMRRKQLEGMELIVTKDLDTWIADGRAIKTEAEIKDLKVAQSITDDGFSYILEHIFEGRTEKEIALDLEFYMRRQGADSTSFDFIVVSGKNSSLPHGVPGNKKIEKGDFITMDFGAVVNGMHSDMTRTVALGHVSEKQKQIYQTVLDAQLACLSILKEGVSCQEADLASRNVIKEAGFDAYFTHSTGHGVGFQIHEQPNLSPNNTTGILKSGNIVTVEPGIYLPNEFGVRIEDMALIQENGIENLTHSNKSLIIL